MKKTKKTVEPVKSEFYQLDPSKPVSAEGYKSAFPWVLLAVAVFFCLILAFIVTVNKDTDTYTADDYKIFYILCGVLLGVAVIVFVAYLVRNALVRKRIRNSTVTRATIVSVVIEEHTTRNRDGDSHTKEQVSLTYAFYDKDGKVRSEQFCKTYGKAPDFYEGQQIVIAFDDEKCFVLSKYTLLNDDVTETDLNNSTVTELSGETITIKTDKYVPLGYDKRYYIMAGVFFALSLIFVALIAYFAVTVKENTKWLFIGFTALFLAILWSFAINAFVIPFTAKRKYDAIISVGATFTRSKLESTNKVFGNGAKTKYVCKYVDTNGKEHHFYVNATLTKKLVRYGDTDIIVAYANDKAVALVEFVSLSKLLR